MSFDVICSRWEVLCCVQVTPTAEEAGHCDVVEVTEIGDTNLVIFKQGEYKGYSSSYFRVFSSSHDFSIEYMIPILLSGEL